MPVVRNSNSSIIPANARAVDVAKRAIRDIMPVQQRRYAGALKVQGYKSIIYNLLEAGQPCSCSAKNKAVATRLNKEGKLPTGKINEMITGGHEFRVAPYGTIRQRNPDYIEENDLSKPVREDQLNENQVSNEQITSPFADHISREDNDPAARQIEPEGDTFGVNGPQQSADKIAELEQSDFDPDSFALTDVSCPVCMGTSYIGGASVVGAWRQILVPQSLEMETDGFIETTNRPLSVKEAKYAKWSLVLPRGGWSLDALRVWNGNNVIAGSILIDEVPIQLEHDFLKLCDGKPHTLLVLFSKPTEFTHVELQIALSDEISYIEFPRLGQNSDLSKLDGTDDVSLMVSPEVPLVRRKDLIVELTFGKVFQVMNVTLWNNDQRMLLGWDANARVVQPQELYNLLPRRRVTKQQTTLLVRLNPNPV